MRISDWSSDVCSSDLIPGGAQSAQHQPADRPGRDDRHRDLEDICRHRAGDRAVDRAVVPAHAVDRGADDGADGGRSHAMLLAFGVRGSIHGEGAGSGEAGKVVRAVCRMRSEEHTSELQSLMRISYAVFCLKKTKKNN